MTVEKSVHTVAVVVPVYLGESTLEDVVREVLSYSRVSVTPKGRQYRVDEVILVNDCGPDKSDVVIRSLSSLSDVVRPVWLSRNFGQHAATIAGIAATKSDWVVTMDEDGQHDPHDIALMLVRAIETQSSVVYARPMGGTSHSALRNMMSASAKRLASTLSGTKGPLLFSSFRMMLGEISRSVAAYAGPSVYLDVALSWIAQDIEAVDVEYRDEKRSRSGYSARKLFGHFWKLAVTTGTRPLRLVSLAGALTGLFGFVLATKIVIDRLVHGISAQGWASVFVGILILGGGVLFSIGIIAEYLGLVVRSSLGQPTYLTIRDPKNSPRNGEGTGLPQT